MYSLDMEWNVRLWKNSISELMKFMAPLLATLGRSERRRAAMHYVEGLLMAGQRKSIELMAVRLGVDSQSLQQLLTSSPWSDEALWKAIRQEVIPHLEPLEAWVVDETGWLKQGKHSVGVSHQYCGAVGKSANCQVSVELVVSEAGWPPPSRRSCTCRGVGVKTPSGEPRPECRPRSRFTPSRSWRWR